MRVFGVGNWLRGDDAVGLIVARRLDEPPVAAVAWDRDLTGLLDEWAGAETVILVDALQGAGPPGSIHHFRVAGELGRAQGRFRFSTHGMGIPEVMGLAIALGRAPACWEVFGVEGASFEPNRNLSPEAARAANRLVQLLRSRCAEPRGRDRTAITDR